MFTWDNSLIVWFTPHINTLSNGSFARNNLTFWCFTRKCFFLRILAAWVVIFMFILLFIVYPRGFHRAKKYFLQLLLFFFQLIVSDTCENFFFLYIFSHNAFVFVENLNRFYVAKVFLVFTAINSVLISFFE